MLLRVLLFASTLVGTIAILIHLSTYVPGFVNIPTPVFIPLFLLLFPAFVKAASIAKARNPVMDTKNFWKRTFEFAPAWVGPAILALLAFMLFNFFFSLFVLNEGLGPDVIDGQFVLQDHGQVRRVLSEAEYIRHKAYELRGVSTHIIFFSAIAAAGLWAEVRRIARSPTVA